MAALCLLDEASISQFAHVWQLLDDAGFEQQICSLFAKLRMLTAEELQVGCTILPTQIFLAGFESLA